jgi:hypothetical protein
MMPGVLVYAVVGGLMRPFSVLALPLVLAACQTKPIEPAKVSSIKTMGVISGVGEYGSLRTVGLTVFGNDSASVPGLMAGTDQFIADRLVAELRDRFDVKPIRADLSALDSKHAYFPGSQKIIGETRRPVEDAARSEFAANGLDAYILVTPGFSPVGGTNQGVGGLGLLKWNRLFDSRYSLFALYSLIVFDGHDFTIIGTMKALPEGFVVRGPFGDVDESWCGRVALASAAAAAQGRIANLAQSPSRNFSKDCRAFVT